MSAISPSGYSYLAQVSSYAGALRTNSDSDAARTAAAQRTVEAEHRALASAELHEPSEAERSADRDADGFYAFSETQDGSPQDAAALAGIEPDVDGVIRDRSSRRSRFSSDDYRGQLIDVQV